MRASQVVGDRIQLTTASRPARRSSAAGAGAPAPGPEPAMPWATPLNPVPPPAPAPVAPSVTGPPSVRAPPIMVHGRGLSRAHGPCPLTLGAPGGGFYPAAPPARRRLAPPGSGGQRAAVGRSR